MIFVLRQIRGKNNGHVYSFVTISLIYFERGQTVKN